MEPYDGAQIGEYRLDLKLGEGAYGAVWRGVHRATGETAAFKTLVPTAAASPEQVSRFHREADLLARVRSPNVAQIKDFVVDPMFGVVLVMEVIQGELLSSYLEKTTMPVDDTIDLGLQLLAGVRDLHAEGIIHRDLKPQNIMLGPREPTGARRAVIFDLGLSRLVNRVKIRTPFERSLTPSFVVLGTLPCIAPEQIVNARDVTERADLYAIGAILHRALTGHFPFEAESVQRLAQEKLTEEAPPFLVDAKGTAARLRDVIAKSIRRRPADRYETAAEMMAALEVLEQGERKAARASLSQSGRPPDVVASQAPPRSLPSLPAVVEPSPPAAPKVWKRVVPAGVVVLVGLVWWLAHR